MYVESNEQNKLTNKKKPSQTTVCLVPEGNGDGEAGQGKGGINGDGKRQDLGW